jgi:hypothetical protein
VSGDAATTAQRILASESLYRLSIVSALLVQIINIAVAVLLYQLLKPVNRNQAVLMVLLILLGVPISMLNELNQFAVLVVLHGANSVIGLTAEQVHGLVPLLLAVHQYGIQIASIFWGLWLLPMGYLVFRSGFLPWILGILLVIGCVGYLIQSVAAFLFPSFTFQVALFTFWGEVLFPLWLLIRGVNVEKWNKCALAPA